jgi:hypothetical protein
MPLISVNVSALRRGEGGSNCCFILTPTLIAFLFHMIRKVHGVSTGPYTIEVNIQEAPTMPEVRSHKTRALRFSLFE